MRHDGSMDRATCEGLGCPHRGCPGCPSLALPYAEQLSAKQTLVERCFGEAFESAGLRFPDVLPIRPSPKVLGYRAGAKVALAREGGGVIVGLFREGSHRVVDATRCPVHHPLITSGLRALRSLLGRAPHLLSTRVGGLGRLRYAGFQASVAEGKLLAILVTGSPEHEGILRSLAARLRERVPELSSVWLNFNPSAGNAIFGSEWKLLSGEPFLRERLGDLVFRVSPGAFLQANREQASWAYREARRWLAGEGDGTAWDLYCGVGGIALHLATGFARVLGAESSAEAISDASATAVSEGLAHVRFLTGNAAELLPLLEAEGAPRAVSLNPPRKGAEPIVLERLRAVSPSAVFYLSCNPRTLARDAALLCAGGEFQVERIQPMDFLPHTAHVETAVLFRRVSESG